MQGELNFDHAAPENVDGIALWRKKREQEQLALARKLGLPIGENVEVWLRGGVRLRGRLHLHEEMLIQSLENRHSKFAVDGVPFWVSEMESCIRL